MERERIVRQATTVPDLTVRCACVPREPAATPSRGAPGESALTMATAAPTGHATTSSVSTHATMHAASRHNARYQKFHLFRKKSNVHNAPLFCLTVSLLKFLKHPLFQALNHGAICSCPAGYIGDPLSACRPSRNGGGGRKGVSSNRVIGLSGRFKRSLWEYFYLY